MENKPVEKKHLIKTINDIKKALNNILEDIDDESDSSYWLMTLLCRTGELELCLNYNFDVKYSSGKMIMLKPNRLCECYEKLGGDENAI